MNEGASGGRSGKIYSSFKKADDVAIIIKRNRLYSQNGEFLKEISCPRKVTTHSLHRRADQNFDCSECRRKVVNTDFMTETQLIGLLQDTPDTCLALNLKNPIFKVET